MNVESTVSGVQPAAAERRLDEVIALATDPECLKRVGEILDRIESDRWLEETKEALRRARTTESPYWDLCTALAAYADLYKPQRYLEIGVRRGRSASIVAAINPGVELYLFDMWYPDYAGEPNPGPSFVESQLRRVGHRGTVYYGTGRSQETIPAFFLEPDRPRLIDLITVDGDHRDAGARTDLENVIPHLAVDGMLVFDDIVHTEYPTLGDVWRGVCGQAETMVTRENTEDGTGTAVAIRAG